VARNKHGLITHWPKPLCDAVDQVLVVALGEICAADAACKQDIAHKGASYVRRIKHHVAGRVPGAVAHLEGVGPQCHRVFVVKPARGFKRPCRREAIARRGHSQAINPKLIACMRADDGQVQALCQVCGGAGMV